MYFTMQRWSVVAFIVCAMILSCCAEAISVSSPDPDPSAVNSDAKPTRQGVLALLHDSVKQGNAVIKEQLKDSMTNMKDLLQGKDAYLDERISDVLARSKVQGDQLKENLDEDIAWLKERLTKGLIYLKEELVEGDVKTNEELTELKEAFGKRPWGIQQSAVMDDLRQQMTDIQSELKIHQETLQSTQTDLETTRADLNTTRADLQITQADLQTSQADLQITQANLQTTQADLQTTQADLQTTQVDLQTTQANLQTTQADLQITQQKAKSNEETLQETRQQLYEQQQAFTTLKAQLQTAKQAIRSLKVEMDSVQTSADLLSSEMGSTFTRWGRTTCPDNTSLVYSGYVGGQGWHHTGGGSNYLCLVMAPQLDNTIFPARYNKLSGAEYDTIRGQHLQDPVCSVCRAPQTTTLMIPATLSCPHEWTFQYRGHLVSERYNNEGRTEFVCLDEVREHRDGGQKDEWGAEFFLVVTQCGPLPCPPYVNNTVVTCVVCSR